MVSISDYQSKYINFLNGVWEKKKEKNSSFSMRSFARFLGTPPSVLSLILNGKRPLTQARAVSFSEKLNLEGDELKEFMEAVVKDEFYRLNETERKERKLGEEISYSKMDIDQFKLISDWYYLAILNIVLLDDFVSDISWIAQSLHIDDKACQDAINRLKRLGLLAEEDGNLFRTAKPLEVKAKKSSKAIRNFHKQNIERAIHAIDGIDADKRDISSIMMPIDYEKLEEAKKMIQNFRRELSIFLKEGNKSDCVYSLNIQLFPQNKVGIE